ncbi:MAG: hypothetical protein H7066_12895 [Cytophagaceae bacterium]|nr:hypothetical protein [Gemmatimonadaceae bacterium]
MPAAISRARACVLGFLTATAGCDIDLIAPVPGKAAVVRAEMLTGNALAALMPDGRLSLAPPTLHGDQVPEAVARLQSIPFARHVTNDVLLRGLAESDRGRWIDPHFLQLCADRYFASAQVAFTEDDPLMRDVLLKRTFGPQWLVPLCNARFVPEVVVQVAVDANPIRIGDKGPDPLEEHLSLITAWVARGLPDYAVTALPVTAERAVTFAWDSLRVRIAEVPQLVVRGSAFQDDGPFAFHIPVGFAVYCHRWRLRLETEVKLRGMTTGGTAGTREVWVSTRDCNGIDASPILSRPLAVQPTTSWVQRGAVRAAVRFTSPVYFEHAELVR